MNKNFTKLAQANVDHFNEHPVGHTTTAVFLLVGAVIGIKLVAKRIAENELKVRMQNGRYARN